MEKRVLRVSKLSCASSDQREGILVEVRADRGEAMELMPWINCL